MQTLKIFFSRGENKTLNRKSLVHGDMTELERCINANICKINIRTKAQGVMMGNIISYVWLMIRRICFYSETECVCVCVCLSVWAGYNHLRPSELSQVKRLENSEGDRERDREGGRDQEQDTCS